LFVVAPAFADAPRTFRPQTDLRRETQSRPGSSGLGAMLPPATGTDKAVSMPRRSVFAARLEQKPPKPAIYPAISRLEPDSDLGQKNALLRTFGQTSQG